MAKLLGLTLVTLILLLDGTIHAANNATAKTDWPRTVDEAVERLIDELPGEKLLELAYTPKKYLIIYHRFFGMWIRNNFGLWRGNRSLLRSCGSSDIHPDSASMVIIQATWKRLREKMVPEYRRRLETLQTAADEILITLANPEGEKLKTIVQDINRQIAESPKAQEGIKVSIAPEIEEKEFYFKKSGKLSVPAVQLPLSYLLFRIEWDCNIRVTYNPPEIRLLPRK